MFQNDFKPICVGDFIDQNNKYKFVIPSFQRGYRWDAKQVCDLLDDLDTFCNENTADIYYLQPLIVCQNVNEWYVLDGQQRLTTLKLILLNLKSYANQKNKEKIEFGLYDIEYQSRSPINFLNPNKDLDINNYYVYEANEIIKKWISERSTEDPNMDSRLENIIKALITCSPVDINKKTPLGLKYIKFIWFNINENNNAVSVIEQINIYNRFNSNKIKLTPSELIKALFVLEYKHDSVDRLFNLLNDWNSIEKQFQKSDFWHLFSDKEIQTRIDYLFNTIVDNFSNSEADKDLAYRKYQSIFDDPNKKLKDQWAEIKDYYNYFVKVYEDVKLYNYFGFLIYVGEKPKSLFDIITRAQNYDLNCDELRKKIKTKLFGRKNMDFNDVAQLTYKDNYDLVKKLLLLYNIETCISQNKRFDFDSFYEEKWEIEHVDCQNNTFTSNQYIKEWLQFVKQALLLLPAGQSLITECNDMLNSIENNSFDRNGFENLKNRIDDFFSEKDVNGNPIRLGEDEKQRIWNLALLDKTTNIGFSNSPFPAKRQYLIKERLDKGLFVPICTERLFLKYYVYSTNIGGPVSMDQFHWTRDDRKHYSEDIKIKLGKYLR